MYIGNPLGGNKNNPNFRGITTPEDCQRKCQENAECKFFDWNSDRVKKNKHTCWLKTDEGTTQNVDGKTSGPKFCPSSPSGRLYLTNQQT